MLIDRTKERDNDSYFFQFHKSFILNIKGIGMDNRCHATREKHTCQCDNKRLDFQIGNQISLNQAECKTNSKRNQNCTEYITAVIIQIYCTAHTDQCRDAANGNINAAGNHHKRHAAGKDDQRCIRIQKIEQRLRLQKALLQKYDCAQIHHNKYDNCNGHQ